MGQKKVVLDTNTLISAFGWGGNPKTIVSLVLDGKLSLVTSPKQVDEIKRVLEYPRLRLSTDEKEHIMGIILEIANIVYPTIKLEEIKNDPEDNQILEAAVEGKVDYIITGDKHLLNLKKYHHIRIVTATEFLKENR